VLLERRDVDVDWSSKDGDSLLMMCCVRGFTNIVAELLTRADLNVNFIGKRELSPLMLACIEGHTEIARMLLDRSDVDVNHKGKDGCTALGLAAMKGDTQIVELILKRKDVDVNLRNDDGMSPFTVSVIKNHLPVSKILINRPGLIIRHEEDRGVDPFHVAASKGYVDIVRELIAFGCDLDECRGKTVNIIPITLIKCQDPDKLEEIIVLLLDAGAKLTLEHVTIAIMGRVPDLYSTLFQELVTPSPLKRLCRKSIWNAIRTRNGGRNVQHGVHELRFDLPTTLMNYLKFS
jgi:ankyrin repeat protein